MIEVVESLIDEVVRSGVVVAMTEVVVEMVGEEVPWPEEVVGLLKSQRELEENGGEVNGGGDDFGVSKSSLGEIPGVVIGESGGEIFGDDGGVVCAAGSAGSFCRREPALIFEQNRQLQ
ncbi:hypothetical protein Tco_0759876 [Tanacetum coccineum]